MPKTYSRRGYRSRGRTLAVSVQTYEAIEQAAARAGMTPGEWAEGELRQALRLQRSLDQLQNDSPPAFR